jgi:hypothetical protein
VAYVQVGRTSISVLSSWNAALPPRAERGRVKRQNYLRGRPDMALLSAKGSNDIQGKMFRRAFGSNKKFV